jgi:uncharacterized protein YjiS (DUF1127 family)
VASIPPSRLAARRTARCAAAIVALVRRVALNWQRQLDREHLHAMDDRLLRDIGLDRHDIDRAVAGRPMQRRNTLTES